MESHGSSPALARRTGLRWLALFLVPLLLAVTAVGAREPGHKRPRGIDLGPLFQLTTHEGTLLPRHALRGRPFVVAVGFTGCPAVCPTTLLDLANHLAALGKDGDRIAVLFVTVDPDRDTAERLKAYLASFGPRIIGLTGHAIDIAAAAAALQFDYERVEQPGGYTVDHSLKVHFFDRYGLLAASMDLLSSPPERVRSVIARLLAQ